MSNEEVDKRQQEARERDCNMSAYSSFEVLDPHDPVISRMATQLFHQTNNYLHGEMAAGQDYYGLIEQMNRVSISKNDDLHRLAASLSQTLSEFNKFSASIQMLLEGIAEIEEEVHRCEAEAYRLDAYTKQMRDRYKDEK